MKLINRQTGNNCYNIIKEYKGGFTARFWQTVAFFFGSSLKQPYDAHGDDQQIESSCWKWKECIRLESISSIHEFFILLQ